MSTTDKQINKNILPTALASVAGDYFALLKPRVMFLVVFTALVGLLIDPGTWILVYAIPWLRPSD